ncbi:MAG TPA: hypothetical protein VKM94_20190 [Blastocatellia bacterium]|nr:hypothetical protein [Blastocatellia bacterium]
MKRVTNYRIKALTITAVAILFGVAMNVKALDYPRSVSGSNAQEHPYRMSEREIRDLLRQIDRQAETFRASLKNALHHSQFDDTKAEDRINDFVKGFEHSTERLKERFNDKRSASIEVEEVLNRAARIDTFMGNHRLSSRAESDWAALRSSLDRLAEAYGVSWSWREATDRDRDRRY